MKLGFLTACMPERSLEEIAAWAGANGYEALELAAWPQLGDRPFTASHVRADADGTPAAEAERVLGILDAHGLAVSALAYYDNNLAADPTEREGYHAHLRACIDVAAELGGVPVGTFVGRDPGRTVAEDLREAPGRSATPPPAPRGARPRRPGARPRASSRRSSTTRASAAFA